MLLVDIVGDVVGCVSSVVKEDSSSFNASKASKNRVSEENPGLFYDLLIYMLMSD